MRSFSFLGCGDGPQHQRMCHLRLLGIAALRNRTLSVDFYRQAFRFEIWNNPTTDPTNALNLFIFNDHRRIPLSPQASLRYLFVQLRSEKDPGNRVLS
jgi:hypothetical protein